MARFEDAIETVLKHEGGFVNHPNDPGGATNWGISIRAISGNGSLKHFDFDYDGDGDLDAADMKIMPKKDAIEIYRLIYWLPIYNQIQNQGVATKVFDMAVNMGHRQAHKLVQRAIVKCGVPCSADGQFGPQTLAALNSIHPATMLAAIRKKHEAFYYSLCDKNEKNCVFLGGWLKRARS